MAENVSFDVDKFFKVRDEPLDNIDLDDLNDETFGDGAIVDDWEAYHTAASSHDLETDHSDQQKANSNELKPAADKVLSKFQDCTLKDLWGNSPPETSPLHTIWSSPDIPSPHRKLTSNSSPVVKMRTVEDLERDLLMSSSPPPLSTSPGQSHSIPPHILHTLQPSPSHSPPAPPPHRGVYPRPPLLRYPMVTPPPGYPLARPHPGHQILFAQPMPPRPFLMRGPLPPNVPLMGPPPHLIPGGRLPHPQFLGPSGSVPVRPPFRPRQPHPHAQAPPPRYPAKLNEMLCDLKPDGSGFMSQKEKEWVIKVQLLQLHTTSPEIEDFYYQKYMEKKFLQRNREEGVVPTVTNPLETMTLPPPVNQEDKKREKYEFENTLGKLSVGSVSAPRKTIDVPQSSSSEGMKFDTLTGNKKRRHVLLTIEEMYNLLLKYDDTESADQLKRDICDKIFELTQLQIDQDGSIKKEGELFFQQILLFKKGKCVLQKILPCLSESQAKTLLLCISNSIAIIVKKDTNDRVLPGLLPSISGVILTLSLEEICYHVSHLTATLTAKLSDSPFFMEFLTTLVKRGEALLKSIQSSGDETTRELTKEWSSVVKQLLNSLLLLKTKSTLVLADLLTISTGNLL